MTDLTRLSSADLRVAAVADHVALVELTRHWRSGDESFEGAQRRLARRQRIKQHRACRTIERAIVKQRCRGCVGQPWRHRAITDEHARQHAMANDAFTGVELQRCSRACVMTTKTVRRPRTLGLDCVKRLRVRRCGDQRDDGESGSMKHPTAFAAFRAMGRPVSAASIASEKSFVVACARRRPIAA